MNGRRNQRSAIRIVILLALAALIGGASSAAELDEAKHLNERLVTRALAMDGTCTGEHGIGYGKRASLVAEHGAGVDVMRLVKHALDPDNRMNPGKVV